MTALDRPGTTTLIAEALLEDAETIWGLPPGEPALLTGRDVIGSNADNILRLPAQPHAVETVKPPRKGSWLLSVEQSGSIWGALRNIPSIGRDEIMFRWRAVDLPGAGPLIMAQPQRWDDPFMLISQGGGGMTARLDRDGMLHTTPFRPVKGKASEGFSAEPELLRQALEDVCDAWSYCRYGLLSDGVMRWLDLKSGSCSVTATPTTALFRARLAIFKRELAARGIYYEDDADEKRYELRFAIEDSAPPGSSFHEPDAALAFTVSGEDAPSNDKYEQARELYDPEDDWETGLFQAVDYALMPARVDVKDTRLVFYTSEYTKIGEVAVTDAWAEAHLENAGLAAGLDLGASDHPSLTAADVERLEGATQPLLIEWNAVDAADRVQRAAYALATSGVPDPAIETSLSRFRGPIVRVLLSRDALRAAETGDWPQARELAATLLPLAPGPFPRRAYAVIELVDALADERRRPMLMADVLQAMDDPLEQRLALLVAARAGARPEVIAREASIWAGHDGADALVADASGWGANVVENLLGALDPPEAPPGEVEEDDRHIER